MTIMISILALFLCGCGMSADGQAGSAQNTTSGTVGAGHDWASDDGDIAAYLAGLPFADELPTFPEYEIPTEEDCEWIVEKGRATSTRGLDDLTGEFLVGQAYRASIKAGHELPIDIGGRRVCGRRGVHKHLSDLPKLGLAVERRYLIRVDTHHAPKLGLVAGVDRVPNVRDVPRERNPHVVGS